MWVDLWRSPTFSDLTLILEVDGAPQDSIALPMHRVILAKYSTYFHTRLTDLSFKDSLGKAASPSTGHISSPAASCQPTTPSQKSSTSSKPSQMTSQRQGNTGKKCNKQSSDGSTAHKETTTISPPVSEAGDTCSSKSACPSPSTPNTPCSRASESYADFSPSGAASISSTPSSTNSPATPKGSSPCSPRLHSVQCSELAALQLVEHVAASELPIALAVLEHMYTTNLPTDIRTLGKCCLKAEYWGMDATLSTCLQALAQQAHQLQAPDTELLSLVGELPTHMMAGTAGTSLMQALKSQVEVWFDDASKVLLDASLRTAFLSLPFFLIQHWAGLELRTDSENTVAILITLWAEKQLPGGTKKLTRALASQFSQLSQLLRLQQLTLSFHFQAMPKMSWWYRPPAGLPVHHALARMNLERSRQQPHETAKLAYHWGKPRKVPLTFTHEWRVPNMELYRLWSGETGSKLLDAPSLYYAGYSWRMSLEFCAVEAHPEARTLSMNIQVLFAEEWSGMKGVKASLTARVRLEAGGNSHESRITEDVMGWDSQYMWGWYDILGQRITDPRRVLRDFAPDGYLPLRITFSELQ